MDTNSKTVTHQPLVSIIMLAYNRAHFMAAAITSALAQTYQNFELIILDDGSTDNTSEIVARYTDSRIHYIKDNVNKGLFARRHESLSHAHGEFVAILDSDDVWVSADKLQKQVSYLLTNPACVVIGTFATLIDPDDHHIGKITYHTGDTAIRNTILVRNQFANSSVVMRTSSLAKTAGYRDFAPCEDLELFLQLGQFGTFANLPEHALAYRVHPGGESSRKVKVAKQVLRLAKLHKHEYPGYWRTILKMNLLLILAKIGLK